MTSAFQRARLQRSSSKSAQSPSSAVVPPPRSPRRIVLSAKVTPQTYEILQQHAPLIGESSPGGLARRILEAAARGRVFCLECQHEHRPHQRRPSSL